jgi:hypothetical protein
MTEVRRAGPAQGAGDAGARRRRRRPTEALAARVTTLGDTRLAVVTAGQENTDVRRMTRRVARAVDRNWTTMQNEPAALSSDRVHVVALRSDHIVQQGQLVVIQAVKAIVDAARAGASLPPCPRVFSGPGPATSASFRARARRPGGSSISLCRPSLATVESR